MLSTLKIMSIRLTLSFLLFQLSITLYAQPITGVWHGKIKKGASVIGRNTQLELKLVRNGDSLTGTSYYYSDQHNVTRYQVKGYFNPFDGTVTWWDDEELEPSGRHIGKISDPLYYVTDFNCPGEGIMKLDGHAEPNRQRSSKNVEVHLDKVDSPLFEDEWDLVIENFGRGAGEKEVIDSVELIAKRPVPVQKAVTEKTKMSEPAVAVAVPEKKQVPVKTTVKIPPTVEEMFNNRTKKLVTEIPLIGDTVELSFYDHAEIDGDSISLFLNNHLLQKNILLKASAFTVKLVVKELADINEMTMVAENLGTIPPNTSLMIAYINGIRYEARLESDENSSAMIRFVKPAVSGTGTQ
jgi:hypothetical protein